MARFFFLNANSKDGFVSLLPHFQRESPRRLYAVKGGPGCGKSTCIRRLSDRLGGAEEYFLCSSDPDSLDGAVLPGIALLDGTAPHVFDPAFPGCDGDYLFLPPLLDGDDLAAQAPALYALKAAAAAHYAQAYRLLKAAALLREDRRERAAVLLTRQPIGRKEALLREIPKGSGTGILRRRFLEGVTPKGYLCLWDTVQDSCRRVIALRDSYGLSASLLEGLLEGALARGQEVYAGYDPGEPQRLRHLLLPGELENTRRVVDWVAETFRPGDVLFSLMSQYTPQPGAEGNLARHVTKAEYRAAVAYMENCGITDGFTQERTSAKEEYTPEFDLFGI